MSYTVYYNVYYHIIINDLICIYQLTELHNQEERDALTALPQALKDVGMFQAPVGRKRNQRAMETLIKGQLEINKTDRTCVKLTPCDCIIQFVFQFVRYSLVLSRE